MKVRDGGAWRDIDSGKAYIDGAWRDLTEAKAYIAGAWETIATFIPPLSASIGGIGASAIISGGGLATTNSVTATPTGGRAPYSYSWALLTGTGVTATAPTSATTAFRRTMLPEDEDNGSWRVTITDDLGTTATADVAVNFASFNPS